MFALLSQHQVRTTVLFMSATMRHPERILNYCGLGDTLDALLMQSPMRDNLRFELQLQQGNCARDSHQNIMIAAIAAIQKHALKCRTVIFVMYKYQIEPVVQSLRAAFPERTIIEYDTERRPDLSVLAPDALLVTTSALKTGANLPETNLIVLYGLVYSLEDWLQAAGRGGRWPGSQVSAPFITLSMNRSIVIQRLFQGLAIMLSTPYEARAALRTASRDSNAAGAARVQEVHKNIR
jgi:superfamily II DNA helicase RecQ